MKENREMQVYERLTRIRTECGMSQAKVAETLEVSRQTISRWETGVAIPTTDKLIQLAKLYGVSLDTLVGHAAGAEECAETAGTAEGPDAQTREVQAERTGGGRRLTKKQKWILCGVCALLLAALCYVFLTRNNGNVLDFDEAGQVDVSDLGELDILDFGE